MLSRLGGGGKGEVEDRVRFSATSDVVNDPGNAPGRLEALLLLRREGFFAGIGGAGLRLGKAREGSDAVEITDAFDGERVIG